MTRIVLAPMEGVLDHLMRDLLTKVGGYDLCVTEFVRVVEQLISDRAFFRYCPELKNANAYGKLALEEYGLKAVYHPHVGAFVETGEEVDRLMNDTDPRYLNLCLDTAHSTYAGDDPIDCARRLGSRLHYLHLKECDTDVLATIRDNEWDYFKGVEMDVFPDSIDDKSSTSLISSSR